MCFAAAAPLIFRPLFAVWMPVARVLGVINLWVICGILYYAVFTPYAWILKLAGWKALPLGADPAAETYWEEKPARDPAESARRLF
ncbi:MAG: hypothetical protein M0D55_15230 [Elusimicrobiota bacterium]|nr:MAG: hypothetical protein M0D55_15230 [Elusimicrobiota bacterium]